MEDEGILALDIGETMGWASKGILPCYGSIRLTSRIRKPKPLAEDGRQHVELYAWLRSLLSLYEVSEVVFESNRVARGGGAIAAYGGRRAIIQLACEHAGVAYYGVKASTVRQALCGSGAAKKEQVWQAVVDRGWPCTVGPECEPDYDASDAVAILLWRLSNGTMELR